MTDLELNRCTVDLTKDLIEVIDDIAALRHVKRGPLVQSLLQSHPAVVEYCEQQLIALSERPGPGRPWPKKKAPKKRK